MNCGWQRFTLKQICELVDYGYTASATDENTGTKLLRITDIVPPLIDWHSVPYCTISEKDRSKYLLKPGDIVVARTGATTGYAKLIKKQQAAVFASYLVRLRVKEEYDSSFVGTVVESDAYKRFVTANLTGTAQPQANAQVLASYKFSVPPLPTQRKIAAVLSAYDDLIENNTRRIQILEEMSQAIYREWFVNFRFPGHENVKLVESELEMIPEGWKVTYIPQAVEINPKTRAPKDTVKPFVAMQCLSNNSMLIGGFEHRTGNSGSKFKNSDTLFARITPCLENGKTAFAQFMPTDEVVAIGSTEFIVMRSKTLCPEFVYLLARSDGFRDNAIKSMTGASGRQRVQEACFEKYAFAHPPADLIDQFRKAVAPMFRQVHLLARKNENLRRTRDLLLPKLVSGEVDVSELDIATGGTARAEKR